MDCTSYANKNSLTFLKRILLLLTIVSVFSGTLVVTTYSQPLTKEQVRALASRAYSLVKSNPEEAAKLFEQVVELDPANRNYHEALGYVYLAREKFDRALDQFNVAQNIRHSDTLQLQIAFTLDDLHRIDEANIT